MTSSSSCFNSFSPNSGLPTDSDPMASSEPTVLLSRGKMGAPDGGSEGGGGLSATLAGLWTATSTSVAVIFPPS